MKKNIAIVMGGYSSEVNISLQSGAVVYKHLNKEKYNTYKVHILSNKWVVVDADETEYPIDKNDFSFTKNTTKITFDCVFNAIHGNPGENGMILSYLELLDIPHTSAPFYQMALTFNKRDTLSVVKEFGINTAVSFYINNGDNINEKAIIAKVGLPCFVKPNCAGSSYGISKVYKKDELLPAINNAFKEDSEILIESFLDGTEVSVGVINYNNDIVVLPITEIVSENDFFDYEAKYEGKSQEITPARISKEEEDIVIKTAKKVYRSLNMSGFSRSEFILVNCEPYFLEMNTVPGLTEESILPQQAKEAGISLVELFSNSIEEVRALSKTLNSDVALNLGLKESLTNEVERLNKLNSIEASINVIGEERDLPNKKDEIFIYRIVQEFLSNTLKYAEAEHVSIAMDYQPNLLTIIVKDDGIGFNSNTIKKGSGLINMKSRAALINAEINFKSEPKNGVQLTLSYPINQAT